MSEQLLQVDGLQTSFFTHLGEVKAVRGVSFSVKKGETLGIVGESGSGKSVTSLSVMRLLLHPGKIMGGSILFKGDELLKKTPAEMRGIRGNEIAMIFQDPMTSLNPVFTVGNQIVEPLVKHQKLSKEDSREKAVDMLSLVGISDPEKRVGQFPHEFSGGMRQRAMIAIALCCEPELLIADEPTTALDVTIQAQILDLIKSLNSRFNMSMMLITHDLGIVADVCSRILVMYGGLIMEEGTGEDIFCNPVHPYTMGLLKSIPKANSEEKTRLVPITGTPPDLLKPPAGCPFCARCRYSMMICRTRQPPYFDVGGGHRGMCWLLHEDAPAHPAYESEKGGVRLEGAR